VGASAVALFEVVATEGDDASTDVSTVVATELSRGPWDARHCHGGPVAALLARAVERAGAPSDAVDWQVARLTVELTRPVPVRVPLTLSVGVERPGRKVSLVGGVLRAGDSEVARVRGLRIRREPFALPDVIRRVDPLAADPERSRRERPSFGVSDGADVSFATHACEHRFAAGRFEDPGPVDVWIRITVPVVAGEEPTGAQRAAAAADFGNGVSAVLPWDRYLFINPDLTVHLLRVPDGEWIGLRAVTHLGPDGAGMAESALHDASGPVGRAVQSLYLDHR
jgi:hypothetical protein